MRYAKRAGRGSLPGRRVRLAAAAVVLATAMAACGSGGDSSGGGGGEAAGPKAPATVPALTDDPLTLSFIWFEWPPAQALEDFANKEYTKDRPNVTIKVNTVPNANWHDAMFTQFAARKTDFDIAILDSQHIGEAVTNGNILDITDFVNKNIDVNAYNPYLLAAYGQYPQAETGQRDENASLYGLPLLGDTWTMIYRKDLIGDKPPKTWDDMIAAAQKCQNENPGVSGLAFHQSNGSDAAAVTYNTVNGVYGGNLWDAGKKQIEGVVNDAAGQQAMDVLVNKMKPLTAKGSGNWFIDEVNAAVAQGKACIAFQWIAASGGLLDPAQSTLGKTRAEILDKLGFATLPTEKTDLVPLGGMGMHISAYADKERPGRGPELHEVVRAGRHPEEVGRSRRRAVADRRPGVTRVPGRCAVQPGLHRLGLPVAGHVERARVRTPDRHREHQRERGAQRRQGSQGRARRDRQPAAGSAGLQWRRVVRLNP